MARRIDDGVSYRVRAGANSCTPPFGSFGAARPTQSISATIPVLHKAGRGVPFTFDLSYDSSIWYQGTVNGTTQRVPTANWGWTSLPRRFGYVSTITKSSTISWKICNGQFGIITTYTSTYSYIDPKGISDPTAVRLKVEQNQLVAVFG